MRAELLDDADRVAAVRCIRHVVQLAHTQTAGRAVVVVAARRAEATAVDGAARHLALADHPSVTTESIGEGDSRKVVIRPKRSQNLIDQAPMSTPG